MRSLYVRIFVVSFATLVLSVVAFVAVFFAMTQPQMMRIIEGVRVQRAEEAAAAYARGGSTEASRYLATLDRTSTFAHSLTDANGRDVITGEDRSAELAAARAAGEGRSGQLGNEVVMGHTLDGGRLYLLVRGRPPFTIWNFIPYWILILLTVAVLCWFLAIGIVNPLRQLGLVVDRFGTGDLTVRTATHRRDEIGDLGRTIDRMADRLQTLVTAERRLLQDISHELRSPLTRLGVAIELARDASDREAAIDRLRKEADRLTALVASLIEVTRAEGDPSTRRSVRVDVHGVLHDVVTSCALEAQARGCAMTVQVDSQATLHGDAELLRRAFENVLRNAIRHAPEGTAIDVSYEERDATAVIAVRDRGPGVPDALLTRLGEPFFRVDESRQASSGGIGLGLSIARRAVLLHHGTLTAENAQPGLRITIAIPQLASAAS
jgi:signal transduction histidine kinase